MPVRFYSDLGKLKQKLLHMAAIAEQMIQSINSVLIDRAEELLGKMYENEKSLDRIQREIDEETIRLIGVYTPVAGDLRLLLMVARINAEIERIGDKVVDIGHFVENFLQVKRTQDIIDFTHVAGVTEQMLHNALNAFINRSVHEAIAVINADEEVDRITDQTFRVLFTHMLSCPSDIGFILGLMLAAQALERIADHAVNIAEDVIYMVEGEDVRHMKVEDIDDLGKESEKPDVKRS
ncbi:MAG TPA: phosphate signaling complex protein PhoU [Sedimentisphaerales bacterium]|nr:phosphate signaling complex protein PhoU [Sedimentisphaerales bacterium]